MNQWDKIAQAKDNLPNIRYLLADLNKDLPLESNQYDIVTANMVFTSVHNLKKAAQELFRVLKNGGRLIFSVSHPQYDIYKYPFLAKVKRRTKYRNLFIKKLLSATEYFQTIQGLARVFKNAGFKRVALENIYITKGIAEEYPHYKDRVGLPRFVVFCWEK